jgi:hypothetical protein
MSFPLDASKASAPKLRPGGEVAGLAWDHRHPSQVQVSPSGGLPSPRMPLKSTTVFVAAS